MSMWLLAYIPTVVYLLYRGRQQYWKGHADGARVALLQYSGILKANKKALAFYRKALLDATGFDYKAGIRNPASRDPELVITVKARLTDCKRSAN